MACGRSVVATRVGGPPEFVPPEAGVLVDPTDVDALAEALRTAAEAAVARVREAARGSENLLPPLRDALAAHCTVGELCETLREEFGMYDAQRTP